MKENINGIHALSAEKLLKPYQYLINQIEQNIGVPDNHWKAIYLDFIYNFSTKVQLLPASESHHHSSYGGLLEHSLETGLNALKLRRAKMLPVGANTEIIEKEKELWSYAIFTAALLHDVGKPLSDQIITLVSEATPRKINPVTETLRDHDVYQIAFRRGRKYKSHENLPLLLASQLIPVPGLNWITSNQDILDDWTLCLTGRKSEAESIGEIITKADQISTAQNLTGDNNISTPAAKTTPLHKRLQTSLTYLLDNDELPLNRQGAAGWVYDGKIWMVSKRVLDAIRIQMKEEGQSGIPADNARIMDELSQHNIIEPTSENLAIWKMDVSIESWKNQFTLLCFPLHKLWNDQSAWPASSDEIKVTETIKSDNIEPVTENDAKETELVIDKIPQKAESSLIEENIPTENNDVIDLELDLPPGIEIFESDTDLIPKKQETNRQSASKEVVTTKEAPIAQPVVDNGFVDWLSNGIADGSITINQQQAMTHTIGDNKDLILVSPKIFREYASKRNQDFKQVQRDFIALGLHTQNEDINIWPFKTLTKRKNKESGKLSGVLIENAEKKLNIRLPPHNSHIDYVT